VFAISGVSGGSVGAAVFDALIRDGCTGCRTSAQKILGGDFLAPALSCLMTRDIGSTLLRTRWPDRGIALERAFERSWRETMNTGRLEEGFDRLWDGDRRAPNLFLNATEADSAERAVFSNVSLAGADGGIQAYADRAPLRLSTAMMLSARFPYISPEARAGDYRFVDGGYFDNSGAATLLDVVRAIRAAAAKLEVADRTPIVALTIANEPVAAAGCAAGPGRGGVSTPLAILDRLRAGRADEFQRELRRLLAERGGDTYLDDFRPSAGAAEFPLGWTLPSGAAKEMDAQIGKRATDGWLEALK